MPDVGIEPTATRLRVLRSTDAPPPTNENASADNQHTKLILRYFYNPNTPAAQLHSHDNENEDVKTYYRKLWFQNENSNRKK